MLKVEETDVLVIGSGGAGLRAAIESRRAGADVMLVSKSPIGLTNCTSYSWGRFRAAFQGMTEKDHFKATVEGGRFLNCEELVNVLVQEAPNRLLELKKFGVNLNIGTSFCSCDGPPMRAGEGLTQPLKMEMSRLGVKIADKTTILELIKAGNSVAGAVGLDQSGNILLFNAKAIILATGGAGQLYLRNDNPIGTSGDGFALAFRVGAELVDMEFVQFFPLGIAEPGLPNYLFLLPMGILRNSLGENFLQRYGLNLPRAMTEARDLLTRAMWLEIQEGRGEGEAVLLDLTKVSEAVLEKSAWFRDVGKKLLRDFKYRENPIRMAPLVHYFMGGVRINEKGETKVKGLYAAGEVAGGVHGANRLGGNSLTDTIVFGCRAGLFAAQYALTTEKMKIDRGILEEKKHEIDELLKKERTDEGRPRSIRRRIQSLMWRFVGIGRTEKGLSEGIENINELRETALTKMNADNVRELREAFEVRYMLDTALIIAQAAKYRSESRGAHYRYDFPEQDKNWLRNILVSISKDGEITLRTQPVTRKLAS